MGMQWIVIFSMLFGAFGLYVLSRKFLCYSQWGAAASSLFLGLSLWVPARMNSGNPNEVYWYFIPACLYCIFASRHQMKYVLYLVALFITMASDGKFTFIVSVMYIGLLCLFSFIPGIPLWSRFGSSWRGRFGPLQYLAISLSLTFLLYAFRILPVFEMFHHLETEAAASRTAMIETLQEPVTEEDGYLPETVLKKRRYRPPRVEMGVPDKPYAPGAYTFSWLIREAVDLDTGYGRGASCIGWIPLILAAIAVAFNWRRAMPWSAARRRRSAVRVTAT